jgi:(5-formylfuran-3-yl)methyl phosphate synthase
VAKLLVSVRSAIEALAAVAGGAAIIDVKEPLHGPLGRATADVWCEVRSVVRETVPVSVALGEINEWYVPGAPELIPWAGNGIAYAKLGLSDAGPLWRGRWRMLRNQLAAAGCNRPAWVAVAYADWQKARAPHPDAVIREAVLVDECRGVLLDTWDKAGPSPVDASWKETTDRIREGGRFLALAGRMDVGTIQRLAALEPEIIAVRGAACIASDRYGVVDAERVARLVEAAALIGDFRR